MRKECEELGEKTKRLESENEAIKLSVHSLEKELAETKSFADDRRDAAAIAPSDAHHLKGRSEKLEIQVRQLKGTSEGASSKLQSMREESADEIASLKDTIVDLEAKVRELESQAGRARDAERRANAAAQDALREAADANERTRKSHYETLSSSMQPGPDEVSSMYFPGEADDGVMLSSPPPPTMAESPSAADMWNSGNADALPSGITYEGAGAARQSHRICTQVRADSLASSASASDGLKLPPAVKSSSRRAASVGAARDQVGSRSKSRGKASKLQVFESKRNQFYK